MTVLQFPAGTRPAQNIAARIEALRRHIAHMAAINFLLARNEIEGIKSIGYTEDQIKALQTPNSLGEIGFSSRTFEETEEKIEQLRRGLIIPPITHARGWDGRR